MINFKKKIDGINLGILIALALVVIAGVGIFCNTMLGGDISKFYNASPIVAKIDGKPVYQGEAENVVKAFIGNSGPQPAYKNLDENSKKLLLKEIAAQRAMLKEARKLGIREDADLRNKVLEFKNKLIIDQLIVKFVTPEITQEKLLVRYHEIEKTVKGKQQIKARHMLLNTEEEAKSAIARLKKDAFAKVAQELSKDSSTKDKGGDLGYLFEGSMDPAFEKAALSLKVGEFSDPVKTKFGWHVIKIDEKKIGTVEPFETLRPRIAQDIYNEVLKKHADSLIENAKIELVELKPEAPDMVKNSSNKEQKEDKVPALPAKGK